MNPDTHLPQVKKYMRAIAQFFLEIFEHNLMADHCSDKAIAFLGSHALLKKMS